MSDQASSFNMVRVDVKDHPVVVLYGDLDILTAPKVHEALTDLIAEHPHCVLVDLANVTFIDSTALGTLVVAHRHLHDAGGQLRLVAIPPVVAKVLQTTHLDDLFHAYDDVDSAARGG